MTNTTAQRSPSAIDAVATDYFNQLLTLSPEFATSLRLPGSESKYSDFSPAGTAAQVPAASAEDFAFIAERMHNLPAAMEGYIASLRDSATRGLVSAARQVKMVISQGREYAKAGGFFDTLAAAGSEIAPELGERLASGARL